jgi:hypothetical protein
VVKTGLATDPLTVLWCRVAYILDTQCGRTCSFWQAFNSIAQASQKLVSKDPLNSRAGSKWQGLVVPDNAARYTVLYTDHCDVLALRVGSSFLDALTSTTASAPFETSRNNNESPIRNANAVAYVQWAEFWWDIMFACVPLLELVASDGLVDSSSSSTPNLVQNVSVTEITNGKTTWLSNHLHPATTSTGSANACNWEMVTLLLQVTPTLPASSKGRSDGETVSEQHTQVNINYVEDLIRRVLALCRVWEVSFICLLVTVNIFRAFLRPTSFNGPDFIGRTDASRYLGMLVSRYLCI